jgi:hypothetical protein
VDFTNYTAKPVIMATNLVNTYQPPILRDDLTNLAGLQTFLQGYTEQAVIKPREADLAEVKTLRSELRSVFATGDELEAAKTLNGLLELYQATPRISWHGGPLHLHFEAIE